MIHETFARLCTTTLSANLRTLITMHVASVDQLTFSEFINAIPNPSTLNVVNMDPLRGSAILEIDPDISFAVIDRLFGGSGEALGYNRELTDIELSVIEGLGIRLLNNLGESWSTVVDLKPRLGNIETNPQFAQIVPPNDMVVLITFEVHMGDIKSYMNLCIPYITIEPLMPKLSAQYWYSSIRRAGSFDDAPVLKALPAQQRAFGCWNGQAIPVVLWAGWEAACRIFDPVINELIQEVRFATRFYIKFLFPDSAFGPRFVG